MRIVIEERQIAGIPVLNVYDSHAMAPLPMLLMLHGFTSCKENNLKDAYNLAKKGFYLILFDAKRHGEREDNQFKQWSYYEKARFLVDIEENSSREINTILDQREQFVQGDHQRIGLIGFSMGGNTIFKYLTGTVDPSIKAAVTLVGTPYWADAIGKYLKSQPNLEHILDSLDFEVIRRVEPVPELNRLHDFPLLMLNGVLDERVPIEDIRLAYQRLSEQYGEKKMVKLVEYQEQGHKVTAEMIEQAANWFAKYI